MRLSVTRAITKVGRHAFHALLETGAFPKVRYSRTVGPDGKSQWESYSLFEYSTVWSKFMKILDTWMKQEKLDERLGVFTRKHSEKFLKEVSRLASEITVEDINDQFVRFHTWCDDL